MTTVDLPTGSKIPARSILGADEDARATMSSQGSSPQAKSFALASSSRTLQYFW
jgi:hypothetical protein